MSDTEIIERLVTELARFSGQPEALVKWLVEQMRSDVLD